MASPTTGRLRRRPSVPLSEKQKELLRAEADKRGIDPDKLIAAAEREAGRSQDSTAPKAANVSAERAEPPKLFQYHLPFVTVREVRQVWLGLTDAFPGDNAIAAEWAAEHGASGSVEAKVTVAPETES